MKQLKVIAFTHKNIELKDLGHFVICNETLEDRLSNLKAKFNIPEIFYIGTCNRVEFIFSLERDLDHTFVKDFILSLNFCVPDEKLACLADQVSIYEDQEALNHLLRISCSLESLVVGEKEILAQVRKAYEHCREAGFTGDYLRMVMNLVVKTAKEVYTHTNISRKPISVVSLAYRKLRDLKMCSNARILIIGAGETNRNFSKYLQKHKYSNFAVFNRTLSKAEEMAADLQGKAYSLDELASYNEGFDVIITCTGSTEPVITNEIYQSLLNGETDKKVIVDLAIPNDTAAEVVENNSLYYIEVSSLQEVANHNIQERYKELIHAERIIEQNIAEFQPALKQRRVELAMRDVPEKIKQIRKTAIDSVFASEIEGLDPNSREVLEKVINYMEKKYISVPMVIAKQILVNHN
ncbi:glutamyl-tRNA reductase [Pedobacter sp. HMF7647]|uniref:Glutamyl-tRNA reductase n=1 Tax=Hufsiella arboris TaxID=2695275 RepID=A0A7K1YFF3_9SPHI|nr:glutamyl-tRNA reductase [Hufsiella arboris]MXV52709.1 glutamyl-tRNA reductase [Hufsiella arboris]